MVYLNGAFKANVTKGLKFYNAVSPNLNTQYTLGTRTVDATGNVNATWVNHTAKTAPAGKKVDLMVISVSGPVTANPGQQVQISLTIKNKEADLATLFWVNYYLSPDTVIRQIDTWIGQKQFTGLVGRSSNTSQNNCLIPLTQTQGKYYYGVILDFLNQITETTCL